jgi:hypothetical protein
MFASVNESPQLNFGTYRIIRTPQLDSRNEEYNKKENKESRSQQYLNSFCAIPPSNSGIYIPYK